MSYKDNRGLIKLKNLDIIKGTPIHKKILLKSYCKNYHNWCNDLEKKFPKIYKALIHEVSSYNEIWILIRLRDLKRMNFSLIESIFEDGIVISNKASREYFRKHQTYTGLTKYFGLAHKQN